MKGNFNTTIRLTADVKHQFDEMKGKSSASQFISDMMAYFEHYGIDPRIPGSHKSGTAVSQGFERVIKIIRAIEKNKIDRLIEFLSVPELGSDEKLLSATKEINRLKAELDTLRKSGTGVSLSVEKRKLNQVVELLEKSFEAKNFNKAERGNDYFVPPVYFEMLLRRVKELCS